MSMSDDELGLIQAQERKQWLDRPFKENIPTPIVVVSGGFDPLHKGHLALFKGASEHGNVLVIVNSDNWLCRKKGRSFLDSESRLELVRACKYVSEAIISTSDDDTVMPMLKKIREKHPNAKLYFANGGDREWETTPVEEVVFCEEHNIELLWNVGGGKIDSSSNRLEKYTEKTTSTKYYKEWGTYEILVRSEKYLVKKLVIQPLCRISFQRHRHRKERWLILEGHGNVFNDDRHFTVEAKETFEVLPMSWHWIKNTSNTFPLVILETWFGDLLEESDIEREEFDETFIP